jgi:Family of unknown function (DUF5320)
MPGFNQRGPMNEGPMTGRRRGTCTGTPADTGQGFADNTNARGYGGGMGRRMGRRGCQTPGRGMGYGQWNAPAPMPDSANQDTLQNRVNTLEAELSALKDQLRTRSE